MGEGEPRRRAGSSFRWRASSSWMDQPAVEYLIRTDREGVTIEPSEGNVEIDSAVETELTANCSEQSQYEAGLTVEVDGETLDVPWSVRCRAGDAHFVRLEIYQGPLAWRWDAATEEVFSPVNAIDGRTTTIAATIGHESPSVPSLAATIRETEGEILDDAPEVLVTETQAVGNGIWSTEYIYDITDHYNQGNRIEFLIDEDRALDETNEDNNVRWVRFGGEWTLPEFKIVFLPLRTNVGEPTEFRPEDFMDGIRDLMPIAGFDTRLGATLDISNQSVDSKVALTAVREHWNLNAMNGEFYYGVYVRDEEGGICGRADLPGNVAASSTDCGQGTPAHEIGHNLSLRHAPYDCLGEDNITNVDPDFPYSDGRFGANRGWVISENRFMQPTDGYDVMAYCRPRFVSDYHYNKAFDYRIESVSGLAMALEEVPETQSGPSIALMGKVDEWGMWSVTQCDRSEMPARSPPSNATYELTLQDGHQREIFRQPLMLSDISHSKEKSWAARVPLPQQTPAYLVILDDLDVPVLVERISLPGEQNNF